MTRAQRTPTSRNRPRRDISTSGSGAAVIRKRRTPCESTGDEAYASATDDDGSGALVVLSTDPAQEISGQDTSASQPHRKRACTNKGHNNGDDDVEKIIQDLLSVRRKRTAAAVSEAEKQWRAVMLSLDSAGRKTVCTAQAKWDKMNQLIQTQLGKWAQGGKDASVSMCTNDHSADVSLARSIGSAVVARDKGQGAVTVNARASFIDPANDMLSALHTLTEAHATLATAGEHLTRRRRRLVKTFTRSVDALLDPRVLDYTPAILSATRAWGSALGLGLGPRQNGADDPLILALAGTYSASPITVAASGLLRAGWGACMI